MIKRRNTTQRIKILEYIRDVKMHPTAETVYNAVRKELPSITLATVYRNLNLLASEGEIVRLEINNEFHYDGDTSNHQHCVCSRCGRIHDIFQREISDYAMSHVKSKEFNPTSVNIIFHGICIQCEKRG